MTNPKPINWEQDFPNLCREGSFVRCVRDIGPNSDMPIRKGAIGLVELCTSRLISIRMPWTQEMTDKLRESRPDKSYNTEATFITALFGIDVFYDTVASFDGDWMKMTKEFVADFEKIKDASLIMELRPKFPGFEHLWKEISSETIQKAIDKFKENKSK